MRGQPLVTGSADTQMVTIGVAGQTGARTTVSYWQCRDTNGDKWCGWKKRYEDNR